MKKLLLLLAIGLLVGCGGAERSDDGSSAEQPAESRRGAAVATMPSASFSSVGDQSTLTDTVSIEAEAAEAEDAPDIALGERVYGNHCAECHGAAGEGGSASVLQGVALEKPSFVDLLRTGGDLGPDHLYGNQKISDRGVDGLFAYLESLE